LNPYESLNISYLTDCSAYWHTSAAAQGPCSSHCSNANSHVNLNNQAIELVLRGIVIDAEPTAAACQSSSTGDEGYQVLCFAVASTLMQKLEKFHWMEYFEVNWGTKLQALSGLVVAVADR
jgi:hypothetical protein